MAEYNKAQSANFYGETPRRDLLKFAPPHAQSWLDIGCGTGTTTRAILDAGVPEVHGVELNPAAVAVARSRLPTVFEVDLDTDHAWHPPQRYDVVSFFDMLEHLQDPWSLLRRAQGWLNPGGSVIASLPNLLKDPARGKLEVTMATWTGCTVETLLEPGGNIPSVENRGQVRCAGSRVRHVDMPRTIWPPGSTGRPGLRLGIDQLMSLGRFTGKNMRFGFRIDG